ncbi:MULTISPECIES: ferritin [Myroides]|uniref:Ferritin n=1 Tax=Myroides albus TaxID=2562892 RepID=A0A6I3LKG0_9FLAO|nr:MULTISPECIES: ferritin [Myroides]MTG99098.1 ferritin [Myroides albus]MVX34788.1 ferritin [Myroides sp. LoEW2-1]UVD80168.1 ferritin [Myroides albus]
MKTNRLSTALTQALNKQITLEAVSAQIYLMLACWADEAKMAGVKDFLMKHSHEERIHMAKIIEYVQERGSTVKIEAIGAPGKEPKNVLECFEMVYAQEVKNTDAIYNIVTLAFEEKDWATWNFLQWLVTEQREEEKLALELLDRLKLAGGAKASDIALFEFDKSFKTTSQTVSIADETNPLQ